MADLFVYLDALGERARNLARELEQVAAAANKSDATREVVAGTSGGELKGRAGAGGAVNGRQLVQALRLEATTSRP